MLDMMAGWLAPDLAEFRRLHPNIQLDISTEHHFVDLERDMVDVAIRLARPTRGSSRLRKLGEVRYGVYASPSYLDLRAGAPDDAEHALLSLSVHFMHSDHDFLVGETAWMLERLPPGRIVCGTDSYLTLRHLCEAGMGLALLPEILGDDSEALVRLSDGPAATGDLWLVVHRDTNSLNRVRLFVDFINQVFQRRLNRKPPPSLAAVEKIAG
jgi:DNA-binding transcriptional LysR family regulator